MVHRLWFIVFGDMRYTLHAILDAGCSILDTEDRIQTTDLRPQTFLLTIADSSWLFVPFVVKPYLKKQSQSRRAQRSQG